MTLRMEIFEQAGVLSRLLADQMQPIESIARQIQRRLDNKDVFSLAYADLDNFKPFNDRYGFHKRIAPQTLEVLRRHDRRLSFASAGSCRERQ